MFGSGGTTENGTSKAAVGILAVAALPVLCCALPVLLGAGILAAAGSWLATHGFLVAGLVMLGIALAIGVGRWWRRSRQCAAATEFDPAR